MLLFTNSAVNLICLILTDFSESRFLYRQLDIKEIVQCCALQVITKEKLAHIFYCWKYS
jgi:hypothetical protein